MNSESTAVLARENQTIFGRLFWLQQQIHILTLVSRLEHVNFALDRESDRLRLLDDVLVALHVKGVLVLPDLARVVVHEFLVKGGHVAVGGEVKAGRICHVVERHLALGDALLGVSLGADEDERVAGRQNGVELVLVYDVQN